MNENTKYSIKKFVYSPVRIVGLLLLVIASILGYFNFSDIGTFLENFTTELFGITLTVLVIDYFNERRDDLQKKQQLMREMNSRDNGLVMRALEELRANRWLYDGSMNGIELHKVNLKKINLWHARLEQASITYCKLNKVELYRSNLDGACLNVSNLTNADLTNTSLVGALLQRVNLSGANLTDANLRNADLSFLFDFEHMSEVSNLNNAILVGANLEGATITDRQLVHTSRLLFATMPDGKRYDGRFNFDDDLELALESGVNLDDAADMAKFYRVSVESYRLGQEWARENLDELRSKPYSDFI